MQHLTNAINNLALLEVTNAKQNHGTTYASHHEAYGVLAEEVQEAFDELDTVKATMAYLLRYVRPGDVEGIRLALNAIKANAVNAAAESAQVAAVCQKWLDWMGGEKSAGNP